MFKNGDRVSASLVEQTNDTIYITSEIFGNISVSEDQLKIEKPEPKNMSDQKKQSLWSGQISASQTSRDLNTIQQRNGSIDERKQELSDTRIQLKLQYTESDYQINWDLKHRYYYKDRKIDDQYLSLIHI